MSNVERRVVCHGSRIETPAAKLQRQLDLLYGLNLTIMDRQTAHKQIVRDEISRVIEEMVALGVGGVHALRSNEETQAEAFSPDVIQADGETWDDANRIGRKFVEVTSSIPCDGTPDLIQATSALLTTTKTRHLSREGDEYIILHELFRSIKPGFCKLKNCILAVSNRNMWFIAYCNKDSNTVGLYIPGSSRKRIPNISIPARFTTTGKQFTSMDEHNVFTWPWATNFYPVERPECEHINGDQGDNRRSNVPLRTKGEQQGNREFGGRRRRRS